jgi:hypothetical protein
MCNAESCDYEKPPEEENIMKEDIYEQEKRSCNCSGLENTDC